MEKAAAASEMIGSYSHILGVLLLNVEEEWLKPSTALTTPKMPIPEPMVVIVGMMSNFPAWWQGPGESRIRRRDPDRKGQALLPLLQTTPTACGPGLQLS